LNDEVETLYLSQYPQIAEVIREVRKEANQPVYFPEIGKEYDGILIMRCRRTIDPGVYLMVLVDNIMFYVIDDIGLELVETTN
jgi:hypothetical protein